MTDGIEAPPHLSEEARARWVVVAPVILARTGRVDRDLLGTYCEVYARWRRAEAELARKGPLVGRRRRPSPLISISNSAASQVRQLEKALGISSPAEADPPIPGADEIPDVDPAPSTPPSDKLLTRRELAEVLGVHMMTVTKFEQSGMPIAERGGRGRASRYREVEVRAWLRGREEARSADGTVDLVRERARRERAQAELTEQTLKVRARVLLPSEEVERVWSTRLTALRTRLLAMPVMLADQLARAAALEGPAGVERQLTVAINEALRELAGAATTAAASGEPAKVTGS